MMKDSLNKKTYIGDIEPNPKEFGIWVKQDGTAKVCDYINNEWKGGASNEGSSNWRYFDLSKIMSVGGQIVLGLTATLLKYYDSDKNKFFISPAGAVTSMDPISFPLDMSIAIDFNLAVSFVYMHDEYQAITPQELLNEFGISESEIAVGEITKEQFYSLT